MGCSTADEAVADLHALRETVHFKRLPQVPA